MLSSKRKKHIMDLVLRLAGMLACSNAGSLACCYRWAAASPDDGCWFRIDAMVTPKNFCGHCFTTSDILLLFWNYEQRFLKKKINKRIFGDLHCVLCYGEVITLSKAWEKPKKANFRPFTLCFVLRWGYNSESGCWRHRETTDMAQSTLQFALRDFSNSRNPRKWG